MKKEIGKWLMDIAKYVVTGGIISTFISNYQQQSWIIYINAAIVAIITFWAGTRYFKEGERAENSKKRSCIIPGTADRQRGCGKNRRYFPYGQSQQGQIVTGDS